MKDWLSTVWHAAYLLSHVEVQQVNSVRREWQWWSNSLLFPVANGKRSKERQLPGGYEPAGVQPWEGLLWIWFVKARSLLPTFLPVSHLVIISALLLIKADT